MLPLQHSNLYTQYSNASTYTKPEKQDEIGLARKGIAHSPTYAHPFATQNILIPTQN